MEIDEAQHFRMLDLFPRLHQENPPVVAENQKKIAVLTDIKVK